MLIFNLKKTHFPHLQIHKFIVQIKKMWIYQKDATREQRQKQTSEPKSITAFFPNHPFTSL